jgi:ribA/ribD-fused uncharacterized protein
MQGDPSFVHFSGHTAKETGYLSNWYESPFELEGLKFTSVEQAMMYKKAILMGDHAVAQHVMTTQDPKRIKALGRQVQNFDAAKWDEHKVAIVTSALMAKFSQNEDLKRRLLETEDATLVEAAHYDKIWGNGLSANHPDANKPEAWPGQNLLGQCLMSVRSTLRRNIE